MGKHSSHLCNLSTRHNCSRLPLPCIAEMLFQLQHSKGRNPPNEDTVNRYNLATPQVTASALKPLPPTLTSALRRGCWSIPELGCHLPSATLDVLRLSSGITGLLVSDARLWTGLRQVGGSSSEIRPSLTSEFDESPLKSDSSSELQGRRARWKESRTFQKTHSMEVFVPLQCNTDRCQH